MSRTLRIPWIASPPLPRAAPLLAALAVHAAAAVLLWPHVTVLRERGRFVPVDLTAGREAAWPLAGSPAPPAAVAPVAAPATGPAAAPAAAPAAGTFGSPASPAGPPAPPPASSAARPARPPVAGSPGTVFLRPPPAPGTGSAPKDVEGALAAFWSTRSAAAYVAAARAGSAPADSVLNPPPTPEQAALARNTHAYNAFASRLRGAWMLEKFQEAYRENFPAMR